MTAAPEPSALERQAAARAAIPRCEKRIDQANDHKLEILRRQDANSLAAIRADRELDELKRLRLRLIAQVAELDPLVAQERQQRQQATFPTSREQARARRLALQPRLAQLASIRWDARNAGQQAEYDSLRQQDYYFAGLERTLPSEAALSKESAA